MPEEFLKTQWDAPGETPGLQRKGLGILLSPVADIRPFPQCEIVQIGKWHELLSFLLR